MPEATRLMKVAPQAKKRLVSKLTILGRKALLQFEWLRWTDFIIVFLFSTILTTLHFTNISQHFSFNVYSQNFLGLYIPRYTCVFNFLEKC